MGRRFRNVAISACMLLGYCTLSTASVLDRNYDLFPQDEKRSTSWNPTLATFNVTSTDLISATPRVSESLEGSAHRPDTVKPSSSGFLDGLLRTAATPVSAAWWLLLAGVIGLVGVSRRRAV